MKTNDYIIDNLKSTICVQHLLTYMKDKGGCYVAGGALTSIATGKHNEIEDYDIYFPTRESCVAAIRYMKEDNPHVAFVSDKSITYVLSGAIKIQFIYYDFYPTAEDIFNHFDFSVNMMAYDCRTDSLVTHENFWMHNSQRFLSINPDTKFPILTMLRLDKYKNKGYSTSRTEVLKLGLKVASLNISNWEEFKNQIGNSYGFTLADLHDCENVAFSLEAALERIQSSSPSESCLMPMQQEYLYPHDAVDFLVEGKDIEVVQINDQEYYVHPDAGECIDGINNLIERGLLNKIVVDKSVILNKDYYIPLEEGVELNKVVEGGWLGSDLYTIESLKDCYKDKHLLWVRAQFEEENVKDVQEGCIRVGKFTPVEIMGRVSDTNRIMKGEVVGYLSRVKHMSSSSCSPEGWAFKEKSEFLQGEINQIKKIREDHLKKHVMITGGSVGYAHKTSQGFILEGGEDIHATDLLLFLDGFNLCFGGECYIKEDGSFSAKIHTD